MTSFTRPIFPFVVGCSRSGTTLLRALLDAHPLVAVPPESHFVLAPDPRALRRTLRREPWFGLWWDRAARPARPRCRRRRARRV
ncbi:MAG: sulfotransferase [Solirubrobacteraceae bacterium]